MKPILNLTRFFALILVLMTLGCVHSPNQVWKDPAYSKRIECLAISYNLARPHDPRFWPRIDLAAMESQSIVPKVLERNGVLPCGVAMEAFQGINNRTSHILVVTSKRVVHTTRIAGVSMDFLDYVVDYALIDRATKQHVWTATGEARIPAEKDISALRLWVARSLTQPLNGLNESSLLKIPEGGPYFPEELTPGRAITMN